MSVTLTLVQKQANSSTQVGSPMGLLLALTYAVTTSSGTIITLISKN